MTFCREWVLVHEAGAHRKGIPLKCRSWGCEICQPERRKKLIAQGIRGNPTTLITLTANPALYEGPTQRAEMLVRAWRALRQAARREYNLDSLAFLAVMEATKSGEPHLHILARMPYVPQKWISDKMRAYTGSPIVDIRTIHNAAQGVAYVAKYLGKDPHQFGTLKRYWMSRDYLTDAWEKFDTDKAATGTWHIYRGSIEDLKAQWEREGGLVKENEDGSITMLGTLRDWTIGRERGQSDGLGFSRIQWYAMAHDDPLPDPASVHDNRPGLWACAGWGFGAI